MANKSGIVAPSSSGSTPFTAFSYEIKGKVQKVFFRKYTAAKAAELSIKGWVMNTTVGTVVGEAEGSVSAMARFKTWLRTKGSPKSRIDEAVFTNERPVLDVERRFLTFARRE